MIRALHIAAIAVAGAVAIAGCSSAAKKKPKAPGEKSAAGDAKAGRTGSGKARAGSRAGKDAGPEIKPPGLDLSPQERERRVSGHISAGRAAMSSSPPQPDEAIRQAKLALAVDETSVDAMVILAHANVAKRYYDQALDVLEKAVERGGTRHREIHFLFGLVYDRTDKLDKAQDAYRRAVALSPDYTSALMNLGVHFLRNQRFADAAQVYEKLTGKLGYTTAAAWTNLGSAYRGRSASFGLSQQSLRDQMILRAEKTYRKAINRDKSYGNAYFNLGLLYLDSDPFPTAAGGELDTLRRLKKAKAYFDEYRRLPGADLERVDDVAATAQKLIAREERVRRKRQEREERERRKRANENKGGNP